LKGAKESSGDK